MITSKHLLETYTKTPKAYLLEEIPESGFYVCSKSDYTHYVIAKDVVGAWQCTCKAGADGMLCKHVKMVQSITKHNMRSPKPIRKERLFKLVPELVSTLDPDQLPNRLIKLCTRVAGDRDEFVVLELTKDQYMFYQFYAPTNNTT